MMNPARFDALVLQVALLIDCENVEPCIQARVLASAVVSLVESRDPQEASVLAIEMGILNARFPRKETN